MQRCDHHYLAEKYQDDEDCDSDHVCRQLDNIYQLELIDIVPCASCRLY